MLDKVFSSVSYSRSTISADRGQKSFKLSFDQFMQKRGGQTIINRGKTMKKNNAALFSRLEQRYGVPAGPLIAIWGMETGFGSFLGKEHTLSAVATLAFDCRRSEFFTDQLYAALELVQAGNLDVNAKGAAHGEIGQTQFLPRNVVRYGVDGDGDGHIDMVRSRSDALASTRTSCAAMAGSRAPVYQQGEPNFVAIQAGTPRPSTSRRLPISRPGSTQNNKCNAAAHGRRTLTQRCKTEHPPSGSRVDIQPGKILALRIHQPKLAIADVETGAMNAQLPPFFEDLHTREGPQVRDRIADGDALERCLPFRRGHVGIALDMCSAAGARRFIHFPMKSTGDRGSAFGSNAARIPPHTDHAP